MADWIIRSKLSPSISSRPLLARNTLLCLLDSALRSRTAILHAPAGFGKTSLLACWHKQLMERSIPAAWLSLDQHDKDPFQFQAYLAEACLAGGLVVDNDLQTPASGLSDSSLRAFERALLAALNQCQGPNVLILDDFHRAESPDNCRFMIRLLDSAPSNVHLVISTRAFPSALSMADRRAHDELVEIDQSSLQFTEEDIHAYLGSLVDSGETGNWPAELHSRTEGWPVALSTVRRWMAQGASLQETIEQISGRSSDLSDYFLEQVFDNLNQDEQAFFLKTSILERVNGDLANNLCGAANGWEKLEDLQRRDLFVQSLDRDRHWYRYHHLFSEFLQERVRRRSDGMSAELHRKASEWFWQHDFTAEAIQHALACGDSMAVATLFERLKGWHYALRGHAHSLNRALQIIDDSLLPEFPRVWLGKVFLTVRRGEIDPALTMFATLENTLSARGMLDAELRSELLIMRGILNAYADNGATDKEIAQLEKLGEALPVGNDLMNAVRCNLLCARYAQRGRFEECAAAGDRAIRHFREIGSVFGETFIHLHEGYACMTQGRLRDAEVLYETGLDLAKERFGSSRDLAALAGAFLADVAYEKNKLHECARLLDDALPHIERFDAWLEVYIAAYTTALKLACARSDWEQFAEIKIRANATASTRALPRLRSVVELQSAELELQKSRGSGQSALAVDTALSASAEAEHVSIRRLKISLTAREYLRGERNAEAIVLLENECKANYENRLVRSFVSNGVLLATAYWLERRRADAMSVLQRALSLSLFEGIKRAFIDEGTLMLDIIRESAKAADKRGSNRLMDRFLAELAMEIQAAHTESGKAQDPLSRREREVLRYLVQGCSNREIGEAIPISVNTVKFHLKNIFGKLGVSTRQDAISASIRRGFF